MQARSSSLPRIGQQGRSTVEFEIKKINAIEKVKILLLIADDSRAISPKYAVMNAENNICDRKSELKIPRTMNWEVEILKKKRESFC